MGIGSIDFYGLKISYFTKRELIEDIIYTINNNEKKILYGYSFGNIPLFKYISELYYCTNNFDIMVTDGRLFFIYARLFGAPLKYDISIPFLSRLIMQIANENRYSMMIIGSTIEHNHAATNNLRKSYPNAIIYDGYDGGLFSESDQLKTVERINKVSPDILFIGVSSPKKEFFASRWKEELNTRIIVPFGGMIDGLAGKVWATPPFLKKIGLASLVRLVQEPKRLFKVTMWVTYETLFRIIPSMIYNICIKRNKNFFIPGLYKARPRKEY